MSSIRNATLEDAARILEIYSYYIHHTAITFETEVPSVAAFRERMEKSMERFPYLVAEEEGRIMGYAYAHPYIERAACDWSCEASIYLDRAARGRGIGQRLYAALEEALRRMGIVNMYASIAAPPELIGWEALGREDYGWDIGGPTVPADPYVNADSLLFHRYCGFHPIGAFRRCGYKFGRWYDLIWVEKNLGSHGEDQLPLILYPKLTEEAPGH